MKIIKNELDVYFAGTYILCAILIILGLAWPSIVSGWLYRWMQASAAHKIIQIILIAAGGLWGMVTAWYQKYHGA